MSLNADEDSSISLSNYGGFYYTEMNHGSSSSAPLMTHGTNVMLGGVMLSGIILMVFVMCYCCHKNARKQETHISSWRDSGLPLHVYTIEGQPQCFESEEFVLSDIHSSPAPTPPPPYEAVAAETATDGRADGKRGIPRRQEEAAAAGRQRDSSGLPTYEAALRLQVEGHV